MADTPQGQAQEQAPAGAPQPQPEDRYASWLADGEEPEVPAPPPEETPPPPEAPPEPATPEEAPPAEAAPPEGEPDDEEGDEEGVDPAQAQPAPGQAPTGQGGKRRRPSWSEVKAARSERDALAARIAQVEAERAQERAQVEAARAALQGQQQAQGRPGIDRPYTQEELTKLYEEDPLEAQRVVTHLQQQQLMQVQQQQEALRTQVMVRSQIDEFKRAKPDYEDAVRFLQQKEEARLRAGGIPEQLVPQLLEARAGMLVRAALEKGMSVAEAAYAVAVADGWVAPQPAVPTAPAAPPVQTQSQTRSPADKVRESRARGAVEAASIASVPGTSGSRPVITREEFLNMSEDEAAKLDREMPGWDENLQ